MLVGLWVFEHHLALLNLSYNTGNVDFALVCRTLLEAGDFDEAEWSARGSAIEHRGQVRPQANLVEVLYKAGKNRTPGSICAPSASGRLCRSGQPAAGTPCAYPAEFGFPTDWRLPEKIARLWPAGGPSSR